MITNELLIFNSSIKKEFDDVERTRTTLASTLRNYGIDPSHIPNVEMAVYETLVNILEHTSSSYQECPIDITCHVSDRHIRIKISNYGDRFDLTDTGLPDIEEHYRKGKNRGLGIYFIRTLMNRVDYSYENGVNCTTLIKNL